MAKQTKVKPGIKTKSVAGKKPAVKKAVSKAGITPARNSASAKAAITEKAVATNNRLAAKKSSAKRGVKETRSPERSTLSGATFAEEPLRPRSGMGSIFAGQSGDLQGLSRRARVDSESVEELAAEGQYYEAEIVDAVEDALDPDEGEVETREVLEDDVPEEYTDND